MPDRVDGTRYYTDCHVMKRLVSIAKLDNGDERQT